MGVQWPFGDLKLTCSVNMCLARVLLIVITTTAIIIIMTTTTKNINNNNKIIKIIIIMYSCMCYFSELEHVAHYKAEPRARTHAHTHTHRHTHTHTHTLAGRFVLSEKSTATTHSVQFSSVQNIYELREGHMRSTVSLRSFLSVAFEATGTRLVSLTWEQRKQSSYCRKRDRLQPATISILPGHSLGYRGAFSLPDSVRVCVCARVV